MEILILFLIVFFAAKAKKSSSSRGSSASRQQPMNQIPAPPPRKLPSAAQVQQTVNQHLFGAAQQPRDKYSRYKRFLLQDRYSDLEKLGHELGITKYQAAREILDLQKQGHFKEITVDEENYKLIYQTAAKKMVSSVPEEEPERTFVKPSAPYRPDRNAAQRHEEWMPLPSGMHAVTRRYCGAQNAVPNNCRIKYTCYFCREEL